MMILVISGYPLKMEATEMAAVNRLTLTNGSFENPSRAVFETRNPEIDNPIEGYSVIPALSTATLRERTFSTCGTIKDITEGIERIKWALDPNSPNELYIGQRKLVRDWL